MKGGKKNNLQEKEKRRKKLNRFLKKLTEPDQPITKFKKPKNRIKIEIELKSTRTRNLLNLEAFMLLEEDKAKIRKFINLTTNHSSLNIIRSSCSIFFLLLMISCLSSYLDTKLSILLLSLTFLLYAFKHKILKRMYQCFVFDLENRAEQLNGDEGNGLKLAQLEYECDDYHPNFELVSLRIFVIKLALCKKKKKMMKSNEGKNTQNKNFLKKSKSDDDQLKIRLETEERGIKDEEEEKIGHKGVRRRKGRTKSILKVNNHQKEEKRVQRKSRRVKTVSFSKQRPQVFVIKKDESEASEHDKLPASPVTKKTKELIKNQDRKFKIDLKQIIDSNISLQNKSTHDAPKGKIEDKEEDDIVNLDLEESEVLDAKKFEYNKMERLFSEAKMDLKFESLREKQEVEDDGTIKRRVNTNMTSLRLKELKYGKKKEEDVENKSKDNSSFFEKKFEL